LHVHHAIITVCKKLKLKAGQLVQKLKGWTHRLHDDLICLLFFSEEMAKITYTLRYYGASKKHSLLSFHRPTQLKRFIIQQI
jgi:hypothetical protein